MKVRCPCCEEHVDSDGVRLANHGDCIGSFAYLDKATQHTEDRYTASSGWCKHPERWHSEDADSTELEVTNLVSAFVTALRPDLVVETGSAWGFTSYAIGKALKKAKRGTLHTLEPVADRAEVTRKRCEGLPVVVEQMSSMDFVPPGEVGFAWFDSLLDLRVPEFLRYYDYLAPGAIVGFHDTAPHQGNMSEMVHSLEDTDKLLVIDLRTPRGVSFGQVLK